MRMRSLSELTIALDDLVPDAGLVAAVAAAPDAAGEDDGPLGLVDRLAARVAGWAGLLEGRAVPSFGPFSTADGSRALWPDLLLAGPVEQISPLDPSATLW